jgi:DNA-binding NarL/FixJ family response regulator
MEEARPSGAPIRIYLVDDHPSTLSGLRAILEGPGMEIIGESRSGLEAAREIPRLQPDVVILDIRLPDLDGLSVLRRVKPQAPRTAIILFTAFEDPAFLAGAVADGAAGFALKLDEPKELVSLVRRAAEGEECLPRSYWEPLLRKLEEKRRAESPELLKDWTERELQALRFMAQGSSNKEIADLLELPLDTIRFTVRCIFQKLVVSDRTRAVSEAYTRGIIAVADIKH